MWVKVCGLASEADISASIDSGADAVGLVLVDRSSRHVSIGQALALRQFVAGRVAVALLVEQELETAMDQISFVGPDWVQPYGSSQAEIAAESLQLGFKVLYPLGVSPGEPLDVTDIPEGAVPLLDTRIGQTIGGSGKTFHWDVAASVAGDFAIAGGLEAGNVVQAIRSVSPWGVDASSRLELSTRVKDHSKLAAFVAAAKSA